MTQTRLWYVGSDDPKRLTKDRKPLGTELRKWLESHPAVLDDGLAIVARQFHTEVGTLDLLGIDSVGRWTLIIIKDDRLHREDIRRSIGHVVCIQAHDRESLRRTCDRYLKGRNDNSLESILKGRAGQLKTDHLPIVVYMVGSSVDSSLSKMLDYRGEQADFALRAVTFTAFRDQGGSYYLVQELHGHNVAEDGQSSSTDVSGDSSSVRELLERADQNGIGPIVRRLHSAALNAGLDVRPHRKALGIAARQDQSKLLMYVPVDYPELIQDDRLNIWIGIDGFKQCFDLTGPQIEEALGAVGFFDVGMGDTERIANGLQTLLGDHIKVPPVSH